jgi:hypothetical protein
MVRRSKVKEASEKKERQDEKPTLALESAMLLLLVNRYVQLEVSDLHTFLGRTSLSVGGFFHGPWPPPGGFLPPAPPLATPSSNTRRLRKIMTDHKVSFKERLSSTAQADSKG